MCVLFIFGFAWKKKLPFFFLEFFHFLLNFILKLQCSYQCFCKLPCVVLGTQVHIKSDNSLASRRTQGRVTGAGVWLWSAAINATSRCIAGLGCVVNLDTRFRFVLFLVSGKHWWVRTGVFSEFPENSGCLFNAPAPLPRLLQQPSYSSPGRSPPFHICCLAVIFYFNSLNLWTFFISLISWIQNAIPLHHFLSLCWTKLMKFLSLGIFRFFFFLHLFLAYCSTMKSRLPPS